jgi:hypothetical protein
MRTQARRRLALERSVDDDKRWQRSHAGVGSRAWSTCRADTTPGQRQEDQAADRDEARAAALRADQEEAQAAADDEKKQEARRPSEQADDHADSKKHELQRTTSLTMKKLEAAVESGPSSAATKKKED